MNTNIISKFPLVIAIVLLYGVCAGSAVSAQETKDLPGMKPDRLESQNGSSGKLLRHRLQNTMRSQGLEGMTLAQNAGPIISPDKSLPKLTQVVAREELDGESIITIESTHPIQYTAFKMMNPLRLVLDFPEMDEGDLGSQIKVNKEGIIHSIRPLYFGEAKVMRLEIVLNKAADYDIQKPGKNRMVVRLKETPVESLVQVHGGSDSNKELHPAHKMAPSAKELKAERDLLATGNVDPCEHLLSGERQKISLDFQDAELKNLFRIFSEISGFNLILSGDVGGTVNMRLMNVPWNQAFAVILDNSGLGRVCLAGNIIRIATKAALVEEEQAVIEANRRKQLDEETAKLSQDLITEVVRINYADINEMFLNLEGLAASLDPLKQLAGGSNESPRRGRITIDPRTNTIILTDIRENLDDMLALIRVLDVQPPQVMIEAKIVEITKSFSQDLGIQWGVTGQLSNSRNTLTGITNGSDFLVDLPLAASTSGFGLALGTLARGVNLNIQLNALEEANKARILSSPRVTTLNNREARIRQGDRIPFETTSSDGTTTSFIDAELSLTVTPHVSSDDFVLLIIDATKNSASTAFTTASSPASISTKEMHTEVLVANGDTTVLGGIYTSSVTEDSDSVPFFSKIPFFGLLFKNFEDEDIITELLIFVTPTILRNEGSVPTL